MTKRYLLTTQFKGKNYVYLCISLQKENVVVRSTLPAILSWKSSRVGLSLDRFGFRATFLGYNNISEKELGGILQRINDLSTTIERSQKCIISQKLRNCKKVRVEVSLRADVFWGSRKRDSMSLYIELRNNGNRTETSASTRLRRNNSRWLASLSKGLLYFDFMSI